MPPVAAPEEVEVVEDDLDMIPSFDLDSVDLEGASEINLDEVDLSGFGDVDQTWDVDHIKIDAKAFLEFLKSAKLITTSSGRDVIAKAISIKADHNGVRLRVTDYDTFLETHLPILNDTNIMTDHLAVPLDTMVKVIKAVGSRLVFIKRDDGFYVNLVGGELPLDNFQVDEEKFVCADKFKVVGGFQSSDLYTVIKDLAGVVTTATNPAERRISFEDGKAYANYMWSVVRADGNFPRMDLKIKDIGVLKSLLASGDEPITVLQSDGSAVDRVRFEAKAFTYTFLISDLEISASIKNGMSDVITDDIVHVDLVTFYKMTELAAELSFATNRLGLNFGEGGVLVPSIPTKKGPERFFKIDGSKDGNPQSRKTPVYVQAKLLRLILRSFAGSSTVRVSIGDRGIGIRSDKYSAALYTEATS